MRSGVVAWDDARAAARAGEGLRFARALTSVVTDPLAVAGAVRVSAHRRALRRRSRRVSENGGPTYAVLGSSSALRAERAARGGDPVEVRPGAAGLVELIARPPAVVITNRRSRRLVLRAAGVSAIGADPSRRESG